MAGTAAGYAVAAKDNAARPRWPAKRPERPGHASAAPSCRIYRPSRSVMQAGQGETRKWVLEFEPRRRRWIEPLMGWTASDDPFAQVRLEFPSREAAIRHAQRRGLDYWIIEPPPKRVKPKSCVETILGRPSRQPHGRDDPGEGTRKEA